MTFLVGELASEIRLNGLDKYSSDLDRAGKLTGQVANTIKAGMTAATVGITAAGAAATALGVSLFKTGAAYNTLQQTSRAALTTILGSTEKVNDQMAQLDNFARTSPFAKQVFLTGQQQLLAFGMQAERVIPTMDALQNAVAAAGGSGQQLSDVIFILAQIQAAGKITGQDLLQFGQRGINAAEMIGKAIGKTGAEVRGMITDGALDANVAIRGLTDSLSTEFAGASANVKKTWVGTTDRIKAANREIGASLAEPFIAQSGGGMAITWGNQVADILQGIRGHAKPVVSIITGELNPAFAGLTTLLDRANVAVRTWDSAKLQQFLDRARPYAPAVAALGGAFLGLNSGLLASIPVLNRFIPAVNPVVAALVAAAAASPQVRQAGGQLLQAFQPLVPVGEKLAATLAMGLNQALPVLASGLKVTAQVASVFADGISRIPAPVLVAVAAFVGMRAALGPLAPVLKAAFDGLMQFSRLVAIEKAMQGVSGATGTMSAAFTVASTGATTLGASLKAAFISNPVGLAILGISVVAAGLTAAFTAQAEAAKNTQDRIDGYAGTLERTSGAITDATNDMLLQKLQTGDLGKKFDQTGVSAGKFAAGILSGGAAADKAKQAILDSATAAVRASRSNELALNVARNLGVSYEDLVSGALRLPGAQEKIDAAISRSGTYMAANRSDWQLLKDEIRGTTDVQIGLLGTFEEEKSALEKAQKSKRDLAQANREAASAMSEAQRSNLRLNEALGVARDVTRSLEERLNAVKLALNELSGGTKSEAVRIRELNDQTRSLNEAFSRTDENGKKLAAGLVSSTGVIDTTTEAGSNLSQAVETLNDQMVTAILQEDKLAKARGESGISLERANELGKQYIDRLRDAGAQAELSQEQVDGLAKTMMFVPGAVSFVVNDNGTVDLKKKALLELALQIMSTPNKEFEVSSDDFPALQAALAALGTDIRTLPEGNVRVKTDQGTFRSVSEQMDYLARDRWATYTIQLNQLGQVRSGEPGYASGGPVFGPGTGTSDSILARLSNGEHVVTASDVQGVGGHGALQHLIARAKAGSVMVRGFADGGPVLTRPVMSSSGTLSNLGGVLSDSRVVQLLERIAANLSRPNITVAPSGREDALSRLWNAAQEMGD